ncbi:MAG: HD domain-containing protein, partial [Candidatus Eremiobacteraeota bacterium]|nr:HD domain-containing protein [Candidatus Eremiobacteraeota bacterium]
MLSLGWALSNAPQAAYGLAALVGAAFVLDVLASDVLVCGRRVVGPGLVIAVAAFVLYGIPGAVLVGCARGIVRAFLPRSRTIGDAAATAAISAVGPLLAACAAAALGSIGAQPALVAAAYIAGGFVMDVPAASMLRAALCRPATLERPNEGAGWIAAHFAVLGSLGAWLGSDLAAGRWMDLVYFAIPLIVIRHGFGIFLKRSMTYVTGVEDQNSVLFDKVGQLDRQNGDLIEALGAAIDARDGSNGETSRWVADTSAALGSVLGLRGARLEVLRRGALLHDIGLLAMPGALLADAGPLAAAQERQLRMHCELGARFASKWTDCRMLARIIEQHHECIDGSGYPHGLKGDEIALEARIVAVADAYIALT